MAFSDEIETAHAAEGEKIEELHADSFMKIYAWKFLNLL